MRKNTWVLLSILFLLFLFFPQQNAWAMHIMEGFLPLKWCLFWYVLTLPFLVAGILSIQKAVKVDPGVKMLLGLAGAFAFVLSALKLPSVTGSCSHPTGVGLGAILFGPWAMSVLGCIVLLFQAVLLAHGGLTTLGANTFSMAVVGPLAAYVLFRLGQRLAMPRWLSVFVAAFLGDLLTYVTTSIQLALAFPASHGGVVAAMVKFMGIFAITQVPLAISEGILTIIVFNFLVAHNRRELEQLRVLSREV
ncbi:cobalt/nickel transport system permease protein [Desulfofundulus luciae]|uniref:Cobalt transport protein CbiM n=1 Tax=Desulfofundulus luciae TaxID=74702 RepID=A0ABU0B3S8_9FIRM|nr:energy-coupling factor ABC transporter permease [Desulfofundulus luciae]MDQ0287383.1 cobalt/nickel transport system permease protein [Desulfofundulus luciae]